MDIIASPVARRVPVLGLATVPPKYSRAMAQTIWMRVGFIIEIRHPRAVFTCPVTFLWM